MGRKACHVGAVSKGIHSRPIWFCPQRDWTKKIQRIHVFSCQKERQEYPTVWNCPLYNTANAYSVIVNKKGVCFGFAGALNYLYNKIGIECRILSNVQNSHSWNIVNVNGNYYQVDLTQDIELKNISLKYFNFTDDERRKNDTMKNWYEPLGERMQDGKICNSTEFDYFRTVSQYELDGDVMIYKDILDGKDYQIKIDGTEKVALP